jgi:hypothetical protein
MHIFILFLSVIFLSGCSNLLFFPVKHHPVTPDAIGILHKDLFIEVSDGVKLHGWKLYAEGERAGSILFFHGNGDNVSTQLPNTFWLPEKGYDVTIFDYRGYGKSQGEVDLDDIISDMELTIAHVVKQLPVDEKLIVMGHSLGASMAIYTVANSAWRNRIKALVTVSAFSDYHDITQDVLSKSWLFWLFQWPLSFTVDNSYRPLDYIAGISPIPILILHSESDEMVAMIHAERLYETAKEPKSLQLIDSSHSNIFVKPANRKVLLDYLLLLK